MIFRKLLFLAITAVPGLTGAIYYVDSVSGSDGNSGTSAAAPWSTLAKVASVQFAPGDYVLLRRGSVWHERLYVPSSGAPDTPITVGAYGSGAAPVIDGSTMGSNPHDLLVITNRSDIVVTGIQLANSQRSGANVTGSSRITLRGITSTSNRHFGIIVYDGNSIVIENSEISNNGLDTSDSFDGIRVDGDTATYSSFIIRGNYIHNNIGGNGWFSSNGIFIGHTGGSLPNLQGVQITGNELAYNGNPNQNQAGRGLTGNFAGDITVTNNYIHDTASAGIYLGDEGVPISITLAQNVFYNNALRQFGGYTTSLARAYLNAIFVDNSQITAMGAEVGGSGTWQINNNVFFYRTPSSDNYRGFIRINDSMQDKNLQSDCNLFYSPTPDRWIPSSGVMLNFPQWMGLGFDLNSKNPY